VKTISVLLLALSLFAQGPTWYEAEIDGQRVRFQIINGYAMDGDIILGSASQFTGKSPRASSAVRVRSKLWPNAHNADQTPNSPSNRAAGGSAVTIYETGTGRTTPPSVDGEITGPVPPRPDRVPKEDAIGPGIVPIVIQANDFRSPRTASIAVK